MEANSVADLIYIQLIISRLPIILTNRNYFNTKIIVADALIVDADVIKQHLSKTTAEPNKIFFRKLLDLGYKDIEQVYSLDQTDIDSRSQQRGGQMRASPFSC